MAHGIYTGAMTYGVVEKTVYPRGVLAPLLLEGM
jgi:hypothetical protein